VPEVDFQTRLARVARGDFDKGAADVQASDLIRTASRDLDGKIARTRGYLEDAAARGQRSTHALRERRKVRHITRGVARVPGSDSTFHAHALVAFVDLRLHMMGSLIQRSASSV
jgi:hypothetical protein